MPALPVVTNRVFLRGLGAFYRERLREQVQWDLLGCARRVAAELDVSPATGPVEGFYLRDPALVEYFQLMRALEAVSESACRRVDFMDEFKRLRAVTEAPLHGRLVADGKLIAVARDALSQAVYDVGPDWSLDALVEVAHRIAVKTDDCSLVGLAAWARDPVLMAAARLPMSPIALPFSGDRDEEAAWGVDPDLAGRAQRFIDAFNALFGYGTMRTWIARDLPPAKSTFASHYWTAGGSPIGDMPVALGRNVSIDPPLYYHWVISPDESAACEFWDSENWDFSARLWSLRERRDRQRD